LVAGIVKILVVKEYFPRGLAWWYRCLVTSS